MPHQQHRSHLFHRRGGREVPPLGIRDAFPEPYAEPEADPAIATVVSVVYVTASPTFTGAIGGYSTQSIDVGQSSSTDGSLPYTASDSETDPAAASTATQSTSIASRPPKAFTPVLQTTTSLVVTSSSSAIQASSVLSLTATAAATSSSNLTSTPTANYTSSGGMAGGAKAGLALGILIAIALLLGLVLLYYRRRKASVSHEKLQDEKSTASIHHVFPTVSVPSIVTVSESSSARTPRSNLAAPRLSLRPVTMFDPNLSDESKSAVRSSVAVLTPSPQGGTHGSQSETPALKLQGDNDAHPNADDSSNPFGDHAQGSPPRTSPLDTLERSPLDNDHTELESGAIPLAAAATALPNDPSPQPVAQPAPAIPTAVGLLASRTAEAPVAELAAVKPSNVHRVQLEFKPSLNDELQLTAGQLVRLLHEYDDGWALCTRLDHSEQGVAPRTCLSKHPIKPRPVHKPQGPPLGPLPVARGAPQVSQSGSTPRYQLRLESPVLRTAEFTAQRPTPPANRPKSNSLAQPTGMRRLVGLPVPHRKPVSGQAQ